MNKTTLSYQVLFLIFLLSYPMTAAEKRVKEGEAPQDNTSENRLSSQDRRTLEAVNKFIDEEEYEKGEELLSPLLKKNPDSSEIQEVDQKLKAFAQLEKQVAAKKTKPGEEPEQGEDAITITPTPGIVLEEPIVENRSLENRESLPNLIVELEGGQAFFRDKGSDPLIDVGFDLLYFFPFFKDSFGVRLDVEALVDPNNRNTSPPDSVNENLLEGLHLFSTNISFLGVIKTQIFKRKGLSTEIQLAFGVGVLITPFYVDTSGKNQVVPFEFEIMLADPIFGRFIPGDFFQHLNFFGHYRVMAFSTTLGNQPPFQFGAGLEYRFPHLRIKASFIQRNFPLLEALTILQGYTLSLALTY